MVGDSLYMYEFRTVDKACKSRQERQTDVKRTTPGHAGGLQQSHRQAAWPCAELCSASLQAPALWAWFSSGPCREMEIERFNGSSLSCLKGSHHALHPQDGSMKDMQEHWAIFGSSQKSL